MPKAKLILTNADEVKRLPAAAELAGVTCGDAYKVGKELHHELTFREPSQLYKLGLYSRDISDADVKAFEDRKAAKAAKRAANQTAKK